MDQNFELQLQNADDIQVIVYPREIDLEFPMLLEGAETVGEVLVTDDEFALELNYFDADKQEDKLWQARTGLNEDSLCGAIETIIFMSDRPLSLMKIKSAIDEDLPLRVVHEALLRLQEGYEQPYHGLRLVEVAEGYQFRTKATYSRFVQDLFKANALVLSPTALEVLAIIAYKQPVARTEVDKIRGVDSSHIVRALMDKRLVRVTGRSEEMGRPTLFGTTPEFLEVFNLKDLSELPPEHELEEMATQSVGKIADISGLVNSGDKGRFMFDEISELDELSEAIKSISSDTDFTLSLKVEDKKRTTDEGGAVKTAFDLLEEFMTTQIITKENQTSVKSILPTSLVEAKVISDLTAGPFNIPLEEEEEEEFEMIDLDTGEPIRFDDEDSEEVEEEIVLFEDAEDEAQKLSDDLDAAFARLTGESLIEDGELETDQFDDLESEMEGLSEGIRLQAQDLDLDLDFLHQTDKNSMDFDSELTEEPDRE